MQLKSLTLYFFIAGALCLLYVACNTSKTQPREITVALTDSLAEQIAVSQIYFDSLCIDSFLNQFPRTRKFEKPFRAFYRKHGYQYVWYHSNGLAQPAFGLVAHLQQETQTDTLLQSIKPALDSLMEKAQSPEGRQASFTTEGLLTVLYFYHTEKKLSGLDASVTRKLGWFIPRKPMNLPDLLDSFLVADNWDNFERNVMHAQYFKLKDALRHYNDVAEAGNEVVLEPWGGAALKPGATHPQLPSVARRMVQLGFAKQLPDTNRYIPSLVAAVLQAQKVYGLKTDSVISRDLISALNVPAAQRAAQLMVNMERIRWLPPRIDSSDLILVNIPDFKLVYFKQNLPVWDCKVVVGTTAHKTVIFSGVMEYVVFSPYWYVPQSIINNEIGLQRAKSPAYLKRKNMEWSGGSLREKPGPNNSLGRVKFIFPNSNSIYLHDTPAKDLFNRDTRAFSHGCIRVEKPFELAKRVLAYDPAWTDARIQEAMQADAEKKVMLERKVPVFIVYLTAFADKEGLVHFRKDIYQRDEDLLRALSK